MLVCGLLAIDQYLSTVKPSVKVVSTGDVLAVGAWSALEFQPARSEPKLETLRQEVVERARALSLQTASKARGGPVRPRRQSQIGDGGTRRGIGKQCGNRS